VVHVTTIGFHCSHEQLSPDRLLLAVQQAERSGFDAAMCSDHLAPWGVAQGESGHAWTWLGAALATTRLPFGVVTAPGQRYHPAVAAQAIATLGILFPGRFWAALGSGEAMNEHITDDPWPPKDVRDERWDAAADAIARLLAGEEVSADGLVRIDRAQVWSLPEVPPPLYAAAVGPATARRAAAWAEGLVTVHGERDAMREVIDAYRDAGGLGPCLLQLHLAWAPSDGEAIAIAHDQWRHAVAVRPPETWDIDDPREFDRRSARVTLDEVREALVVEHEPRRLADRIAHAVEAGFDGVYLHQVAKDQAPFLALAERELLPALRERLA
jgi:probable non-F420 flavinoid oxidoreductase